MRSSMKELNLNLIKVLTIKIKIVLVSQEILHLQLFTPIKSQNLNCLLKYHQTRAN